MDIANWGAFEWIAVVVIGYLFYTWYTNKYNQEGFWSGTPATFFPRMYTLPNCLSQQNVEWFEKGIPVSRHYNLEGQRAYFYH